MNAFRFENPLMLFGLLLLVPLIFRWLGRPGREAVTFSSLDLLAGIDETWRARLRAWVPVLRIAGLACVVVALARPQEGVEGFRARAEGIAIAVCIDRSVSMSVEDFKLNDQAMARLEVVKRVIRRFVLGDGSEQLPGRWNDLVGVVSFGGVPEVRCPLTLDHQVVSTVLDDIDLPDPPRDLRGFVTPEAYDFYLSEGATAIGDAIALSVDLLSRSDSKSRVLVLLSDGENNAGLVSPDRAAQIARERGVRIYSIGVGSPGKHFVRMVTRQGQELKRPTQLKLDVETLTRVATQTGGRYFHARSTDALMKVYREINALEKTGTEGTRFYEYRELFRPWLLCGLVLILTEVLLTLTVLRSAV